jgi:hypothetical protein
MEKVKRRSDSFVAKSFGIIQQREKVELKSTPFSC